MANSPNDRTRWVIPGAIGALQAVRDFEESQAAIKAKAVKLGDVVTVDAKLFFKKYGFKADFNTKFTVKSVKEESAIISFEGVDYPFPTAKLKKVSGK
jgi:hypothetical protein